jgi:hypothetical protein
LDIADLPHWLAHGGQDLVTSTRLSFTACCISGGRLSKKVCVAECFSKSSTVESIFLISAGLISGTGALNMSTMDVPAGAFAFAGCEMGVVALPVPS